MRCSLLEYVSIEISKSAASYFFIATFKHIPKYLLNFVSCNNNSNYTSRELLDSTFVGPAIALLILGINIILKTFLIGASLFLNFLILGSASLCVCLYHMLMTGYRSKLRSLHSTYSSAEVAATLYII